MKRHKNALDDRGKLEKRSHEKWETDILSVDPADVDTLVLRHVSPRGLLLRFSFAFFSLYLVFLKRLFKIQSAMCLGSL